MRAHLRVCLWESAAGCGFPGVPVRGTSFFHGLVGPTEEHMLMSAAGCGFPGVPVRGTSFFHGLVSPTEGHMLMSAAKTINLHGTRKL